MNTKLFVKGSIILLFSIAVFSISCEKDSESDNNGSSLRILKSPQGGYQTLSANIDENGYTNFNAQTVLADGGSPLHNYTWSLDMSSNPPSGVTIEPLTGVINRLGHSSTGLSVGTSSFKVKVSDGSASTTENVTLIVTDYTPGPAAILQQLSSDFQLVDGEANKPYGASLWATGGTPPYKWHLDATYPGSADLTGAGLTVEANGGIVSGTILNSAAGKTIKFKVIVTDANNETAVFSPVYTIKVN